MSNSDIKRGIRRFFSDDSFWNTPLPEKVQIDDRSGQWIELLKEDPTGNNFGINLKNYTIPIYEAGGNAPLIKIHQRKLTWTWDPSRRSVSLGPGFGNDVPLPSDFEPSPGTDSHATIINREKNLAWDMFGVKQRENGEWEAYTGMLVPLDGPGIFDPEDFDIEDGQSVHSYGPSRAAGVPSFAGTIMHEEAAAGEIKHKLSCALRYVAYREFTYPAIWTDGACDGGIPEGAVIQLDPELELSQFDLHPGERAVAKALQEYGAVVVDFAGASVLYGEGLWYDKTRSWDGILREWDGGINSIPLDHYRVLRIEHSTKKGDAKHPMHAKSAQLRRQK